MSKLTWHSKLGHPAEQALNCLKDKLNFVNTDLPPYDVCHKDKQNHEPFHLSVHSSSSLGELIHFDVWGPYRVTTRVVFRYFLIVVDDFTRATWVYLLKSKDEVHNCFTYFFSILLK